MKPRFIGTVAVLLLCSSVADAADTSPALYILVEGLDTDAAHCGLTSDSVASQATLTLRANGIRVVEAGTNPYLYINLNIMQVGQQACIVSIEASVTGQTQEDIANTRLGNFRSRKGRITILCSSEAVMRHSLNTDTSRAILSALETVIKTCIGKLDY